MVSVQGKVDTFPLGLLCTPTIKLDSHNISEKLLIVAPISYNTIIQEQDLYEACICPLHVENLITICESCPHGSDVCYSFHWNESNFGIKCFTNSFPYKSIDSNIAWHFSLWTYCVKPYTNIFLFLIAVLKFHKHLIKQSFHNTIPLKLLSSPFYEHFACKTIWKLS